MEGEGGGEREREVREFLVFFMLERKYFVKGSKKDHQVKSVNVLLHF